MLTMKRWPCTLPDMAGYDILSYSREYGDNSINVQYMVTRDTAGPRLAMWEGWAEEAIEHALSLRAAAELHKVGPFPWYTQC